MNGMKYPFDKDLAPFRHFHPPLFRGILSPASLLLKLAPKGFHKDKVAVERIEIDGIRMNIITPRGLEKETTPLLFYIHGGGFFFRAALYHYRNEESFALNGRCRVVDCDYSLLPKHYFPTQREECLKVYRYLYDHRKELRLDMEHVLFAGDSAGGSLCLDTYLRAKEEGLPLPEGMMLFYPVVTPDAAGPSKKQFVDTPCWDAKSDEKMWKLYLKGQTYFSPLKRLDEFSLEHLYLETCEFDCLKDEGLALYRGLENKVGHKELFETKGTFHGFDSVKKAKISQETKKRRLLFLSEVISMWQKEI